MPGSGGGGGSGDADAVQVDLDAHEALTTGAHGGIVAASDPRLMNARTPTAHAASHASGGSDALTLSQSQVTNLVTDLAAKQPLDADLTAIAALDSGTSAGVMTTTGSGWVKSTYAALKTALGLTKSDVGLGSVDNTSDASKPVSTAQAAAITAASTTDRDRANHTGTQAQSTVTNLTTDLAAKQPLDADLTTIAGLTATTDNIMQAKSGAWASRTLAQFITDLISAGLKTSLALVKGDVGLGSVDNTSDASKPVSTAQAASIATKQPLDSDLTTIAALDSGTSGGVMATDAAGWVKKSYTALKTSLGLTKADVGLASVDNTADTAKPISTAQQTAFDLKAPIANPAFTGIPTAATPPEGTNTNQLATMAALQTATGSASSNRPVAGATSSTAQAIANATWTAVAFSTEVEDTDGMVNLATINDRFVCVTPGRFTFSGSATIAANSTGFRGVRLSHRTAANALIKSVYPDLRGAVAAPTVTEMSVTGQITLAAGEYVALEVYQSSGAPLSTAAGSGSTFVRLDAEWVGGTGAAWGNASCFAYATTSSAALPGSGETLVLLGGEQVDNTGMHSTVTNTERVTVQVAGDYALAAQIGLGTSTAAVLYAYRIKLYNAAGTLKETVVYVEDTRSATATARYFCVPMSRQSVACDAGDYFVMTVEVNVAASFTYYGGTLPLTYLSVTRNGYQTNPSKDGQKIAGVDSGSSTTNIATAAASTTTVATFTVTGDGVNRIFYDGQVIHGPGAGNAGIRWFDGATQIQDGFVAVPAGTKVSRLGGWLEPFTGTKTITMKFQTDTASNIYVNPVNKWWGRLTWAGPP